MRGRPHKNDFDFPLSLHFTRGVRGDMDEPMLIVFALAMAWSNERDRLRLQMLLNSRPGTRIVTVSESEQVLGKRMPHFSCDFSTVRGHKSLATRISEERKLFPNAKIIATLDWYWLPIRYFGTRYGKLWLESGMHCLLTAGADEVLLPFDNGDLHHGESDMVTMLAGKKHANVQLEFVPLASNPVWTASSEKEIEEVLASFRGGDNAENTRKWLSSTTPFVRGTLASRP